MSGLSIFAPRQELYCPSQGVNDPVADEWERQVLCLKPVRNVRNVESDYFAKNFPVQSPKVGVLNHPSKMTVESKLTY